MMKVDSSFYENGCTMDGKGNRVFLDTKDENTSVELTFVGNTVGICGSVYHTTLDFSEIEKISAISHENHPLISIQIKN